jgi:hypothetical protein
VVFLEMPFISFWSKNASSWVTINTVWYKKRNSHICTPVCAKNKILCKVQETFWALSGIFPGYFILDFVLSVVLQSLLNLVLSSNLLYLPSSLLVSGDLQCVWMANFFFWWDWSLNSWLCACKAGALLIEPHLQYVLLWFSEMRGVISGTICPSLPGTSILLISASQVPGLQAWDTSARQLYNP